MGYLSDAETFEHAGVTVAIWQEQYIEDFFDPRQDEGTLGVMFCEHPDYELGDKNAPDPRDKTVDCDVCDGTGEQGEDECQRCEGTGELEVGIVEYLKREHGARVILPLFLYDHSGISMSVGSRMGEPGDERKLDPHGHNPFDSAAWDTSSVGVIFDTDESRKACGFDDEKYPITDEQIEKNLRSEVEYYDAYLRGNVYGFSIIAAAEDEDGILRDTYTGDELDHLEDGEVIDSCGGFIDPDIWNEDKSHTYSEARAAAECAAQSVKDETRERDEWEARDVQTVGV